MAESPDVHFGMKKLALQNWREPDVPKSFDVREEDWVEAVMKPALTNDVPDEIAAMFEVARGSVLYGWFFYPLLTLADEQLFRVQEAAVRARCRLAGIALTRPVGSRTESRRFVDLISDLKKSGVIPADVAEQWDAVRQLRNSSSHPERQAIIPPGHALGSIDSAARRINQLFAANQDYFSILRERTRSRTGLDDVNAARPVVAGIDVGGVSKGFHIVALRGTSITGTKTTVDANEAVAWCHAAGARLVGVDAPCGWSRDGAQSREAEQMLARMSYSAHATPNRGRAEEVPFYRWMLNGERLYQALQVHYPVFRGGGAKEPMSFETYPYLAACSYAGRRLKAKEKSVDRRNIVRAAGIDDSPLTNGDLVDAAICALVALSVTIDYATMVGNPEEGFILFPCL